MKILRSIHSVNPVLGGPIESVRQSSAVLTSRGHEVEIVSLDAPTDSWIRDWPVPVHAVGPGFGNYGYAPRFSSWVGDQHKKYDAVIVQGIWQYNSFAIWRALHRTQMPYFVFPHGMLDPWFKQAYPLKHLKKLLYWSLAEHRVLRDAAAVLFTSEEEKRLARKSFPFYRCREVVVNYGTAGPKTDLASAREDFFTAFPPLRGRRFLLFLGRLHEKKGCELLLEAFIAASESRAVDNSLELVVAGPCMDKAYQDRLKGIARGRSSISFVGMLTGTQKWGALSAADAFVLPSHQENFGIAVVEALACGTPVLISNKINISGEIAADKTGYVENDDLPGTIRLLERWSDTMPEEREALRKNARESFLRRFEINRATDSLLRVLEGARRSETLTRPSS
jgi:glycosyltransferase involved in cell wall biosynthesis